MRPVWKLLVSLRTAVFLLAVLTALALLGTLIPQGLELTDYPRRFPRAGEAILGLGLDDLYHSLPFLGTLALLAFSALICTVTRFRLVRQRLQRRLELATLPEIESLPVRERVSLDRLAGFTGLGTPPRPLSDGTILHFRARGRASLLGGLLLHVGFLVILVGGLWGFLAGVEMAVTGSSGEETPVPSIGAIRAAARSDRLKRLGRGLEARSPHDSRLPEIRRQVEDLDRRYLDEKASPTFVVGFEDLWVDYHAPDRGVASASPQVRSWNTRLSIKEQGAVVASGVVRVNAPFSFREFTFFQADWERHFSTVHFRVVLPDGVQSLTLELEQPVKPSWSRWSFVLIDFLPDFRTDGDQLLSASDELKRPAARIAAYDAAGKLGGQGWAFAADWQALASHVSTLPHPFTVVGAEPGFSSGLQLTYDPGVPVVWLGCLLFTLGLGLTFYLVYREDWVAVRPDGVVVVAMAGNRPAAVLRHDLDALLDELSHPVQPPVAAGPSAGPADEG